MNGGVVVEIEKFSGFKPDSSALVKVTEMGNVTEVQYMSRRNILQTIQLLPGGEEYVHLSTGEVKQVTHHTSRADDYKSLRKTFARCRNLINANVTDVSHVRWCTLTYAENMTDTRRLYSDFRKFIMRLNTYIKSNKLDTFEYIAMMEPQGRGAWHVHMLLIWQGVAPYIPNSDLSRVWGHGFVKINALDNVDNVGAYLTAYLADMTLEDAQKDERAFRSVESSEMKCIDGQSKAVLKGARLSMYPVGFNMIRHSKGLREPEETYMTYSEAEKKTSGATEVFSSTFKIKDTNTEFESIIYKAQYNKSRK